MRTIDSFDELLALLRSLEGKSVEAFDSSDVLSVIGTLSQQADLADAEIDALVPGQAAESAEMFHVGAEGRLALFATDFRSATWNTAQHELTLTTRSGTILIHETFWNK